MKCTLTISGLILVVTVSSALIGCKAEDDPNAPSSQKQQAVEETAQNNKYCIDAQPFYWEVGDKDQQKASGWAGGVVVDPNTPMDIASASKWIFGTYALQKMNGNIDEAGVHFLTMTSGYEYVSNLKCLISQTVNECNSLLYSPKDKQNEVFHYDAGHFQEYAATTLNLGNHTAAQLSSEFSNVLGVDLTFKIPQMAGGISMSPAMYGKFLRKILNHSYIMSNFLGSNPVVTDSDLYPAQSSYSPVTKKVLGQSWHYSIGHWIEDDPTSPFDDAYSSGGAFGFYPWIDASSKYYGILARKSTDSDAAIKSVQCGQRLRAAWLLGTAIPADM